MRRTLALIVVMGVFGTAYGCGGRSPHPVAQYQPGDEQRTCDGLRMEVANNEQQIATLLPDQDATGKNVALGVTGAFFIVPLFFMDFKDAEGIEIEALKRRNNWLREVSVRKNCDLPPSMFLAENTPCSDAKNAKQPWIGRWAARHNKDILALEVTEFQVNGQYITPSATFEVGGRVDEKGEVAARISSSWANGELRGSFPNLEARPLDDAEIGSLKTGDFTQFTLCVGAYAGTRDATLTE